jgi:hypothetical protein
LRKALTEKKMNISDIDRALGRAMTMRMRAGMFDAASTVPYKTIGLNVMNNAYGQSLALAAVFAQRDKGVSVPGYARMLLHHTSWVAATFN